MTLRTSSRQRSSFSRRQQREAKLGLAQPISHSRLKTDPILQRGLRINSKRKRKSENMESKKTWGPSTWIIIKTTLLNEETHPIFRKAISQESHQ